MEKVSQFVARVFLGHIFLLAGASKISAYEGTQGYMILSGFINNAEYSTTIKTLYNR